MKLPIPRAVALLFVLFAGSSCVQTYQFPLPEVTNQDLEVYYTKLPERDYTEIGIIVAASGFAGRRKLLDGLLRRGVYAGADAIIDVEFSSDLYLGNQVRGMAIKYVD